MRNDPNLFRSYALSVLMFALSAAPVSAASVDNGPLPSPEQITIARDICTNITRIAPGVFPFDGCVQSLAGTLSNQMQSEILARSYRDCLESGQKDGTPQFAACVVDRKSSHITTWNNNPRSTVPNAAAVNPVEQKSYFESSFDERLKKREYSCARLGMAPGSPGFSECVARLNAALQYSIE